MIDRRSIITALPILAVLGGVGTALLSYLKPTWKPLALPSTEKPLNKDLIAASLSEFPEEFDYKAFTFTQITVEYSARGTQATDILGFLVRVPNDQMSPTDVGVGPNSWRRGYAEAEFNGQKYSMVAVSRICAHLGCIFEYKEPADVCSGFNYCDAKTPHFACPCHLSVYNPVQAQDVPGFGQLPGRVVSGPAPRTPFPFDFVIENGNVIIKNYG